MKKNFEEMAKHSLISEELVKDFLTTKFGLQFHCVPHLEQLAMISKDVHVPDILCVEKPHVAFEVKEDIRSRETGNLAFELDCLAKLRAWGWGSEVKNIYLIYINHYDFGIDVFELGMMGARLELELKAIAAKDYRCRLLAGGDSMHDLYIIPLGLARQMNSCLTKRFFDTVDLFLFAKAARQKLADQG